MRTAAVMSSDAHVPPPRARRWYAQPALHFALLGAAAFAVYRARHPAPLVEARRIVVSAAFVRGVEGELRAQHGGRAPDEAELRREVARYVDEEVLYREALALGLDRGDVIVRRRLAQKMEFLVGDHAAPAPPDDAALARFVAAHRDRYALPARVSYEQVFFDAGRRGGAEGALATARAALAALRADPAAASPAGDPFPLGGAAADQDEARLRADLGPDFAAAVFALAPAQGWSGPVRSRYGAHLVRVTARLAAGLPPLDAVRARAAQDWLDAARERARADALAQLRARYTVEMERP